MIANSSIFAQKKYQKDHFYSQLFIFFTGVDPAGCAFGVPEFLPVPESI
jgi:hypothetical protein